MRARVDGLILVRCMSGVRGPQDDGHSEAWHRRNRKARQQARIRLQLARDAADLALHQASHGRRQRQRIDPPNFGCDVSVALRTVAPQVTVTGAIARPSRLSASQAQSSIALRPMPEEALQFLRSHGLESHAGIICDQLGIERLSDFSVLLPSDVEQVDLKPVQRRRLLSIIGSVPTGMDMAQTESVHLSGSQDILGVTAYSGKVHNERCAPSSFGVHQGACLHGPLCGYKTLGTCWYAHDDGSHIESHSAPAPAGSDPDGPFGGLSSEASDSHSLVLEVLPYTPYEVRFLSDLCGLTAASQSNPSLSEFWAMAQAVKRRIPHITARNSPILAICDSPWWER